MSEELNTALKSMGEKLHEMRAANDQALDAKASDERVSEAESKLEVAEKSLSEVIASVETLQKQASRRESFAGVADENVEAHKAALMGFIRKGQDSGLADLERKAVNLGVDADGGFALTDEMDTTIGQLVRDLNPMRGVANVISVGNETYSKLFNQGGSVAGWVGEEAARPVTATSTLAKVTPSFGEVYANPSITQKALDDMFFNAEAWMNSEVAEEFAAQENLAFTSGNGTNKPKGILAYTFAASPNFGQIKKIDSTVSVSFGADDFISMVHAIKQGYRTNRAVFMMNDLSVAVARKLKDGQGNYIWSQGYQAGEASSILGYSVVENHDLPDLAAGANSVLFGDFNRAYTIADVRGTRILRDPFTAKPYVTFYTTKRVGGGLMDSAAVVSLQPIA